MADMTPILIKDLAEQTTAADTDYMVIGGADAKKIKWSTIWGLIRDKLGIGTATLATNDKTVKGAINELNTNISQKNDGRYIIPGGLKIQWGYTTARKVTFPVQYTTAPLIFLGSLSGNTDGYLVCTVTSRTIASFTYTCKYQIGTQTGDATEAVQWIAIGY